MPGATSILRPAALALLAAGFTAGSPEFADAQAEADASQAALQAFVAGDLGRAEALAAQWLKTHPRDAQTHLLLGLVRVSAGLAGEAQGRRPYRDVLAMYSSALESLLEAERLAAGRPLHKLDAAVGTILLARNELEAAEQRFSRALALAPRDAVLHRQRGKALLGLGRYGDAEAALQLAIKLDPGALATMLLYAESLFRRGRERSARDSLIAYYDEIRAAPPDKRHFQVSYEIARYSILLNDLASARSALERAVGLDPSNSLARSELGRVAFWQGELDVAKQQFDGVLAGDARRDLHGDAWYHKGMIASARRDDSAAAAAFEAALRETPERAAVLQEYGAVLRRLGRHPEARSVLDRFAAVVVLENQVRRLQDVLLVSPGDVVARRELVDQLLALGRRDEAAAALAELQRVSPDDSALPELERRLRDGN